MLMKGVDVARLHEVCQRYGIERLEVFGSVARGVADDESDIDLLYTLAPHARLGWAIEDLSVELSTILGRQVDLVSRGALNARLRDNALAEPRPIYAAA